MPTRKANARWEGGLKEGKGNLDFGNGAYSGAYSFSSRFEEGKGTNPEELIAAAHAACFSMALSGALEKEGFKPQSVATKADVHLDKSGGGFEITKIVLNTEASVPDIEEQTFKEHAEKAKKNCPVSKALSAIKIELNATLK